VPESIAKLVIEGQRELGVVIDQVAGQRDVRSRQGAWGILSTRFGDSLFEFRVGADRGVCSVL